jgi:hypothetical protein
MEKTQFLKRHDELQNYALHSKPATKRDVDSIVEIAVNEKTIKG